MSDDLRANRWFREFETPAVLLRYEARYAMGRGEFVEAVSIWDEFFRQGPVAPRTEAGAWPVLDHGVSLVKSGRRLQVARVLQRGQRLDRRGVNNGHWLRRVDKELGELPFSLRLLAGALEAVRWPGLRPD